MLKIAEIIENHKAGKTVQDIIKLNNNKDRYSIAEIINASGFVATSHARYKYNTEFFKCIDTEEKAYWLGFLYADGCVRYQKSTKSNQSSIYKIELSLAVIDLDHLTVFKNIICEDSKIYTKYKHMAKSGKIFEQKQLIISNNFMVTQLMNLGCKPNKSLTVLFPSEVQVPINLRRHFIRGYFDGDGSVSWKQLKKPNLKLQKIYYSEKLEIDFCGSQVFLEVLQNYLLECHLLTSRTKIYKYDRSKIHNFKIGKNYDIKTIFIYLYKDAKVFLNRKYNVFLDFYKIKNVDDLPCPQVIEDIINAEKNWNPATGIRPEDYIEYSI